MALFRKFFYKKPPDGLLEIAERVYVFDCCFTTEVWEEEEEYRAYIGGVARHLREHSPEGAFMVFNFREGEGQSRISSILSAHDMTVMDYPRHHEGCPLLAMEMVHHFLRSSESWLSLGPRNSLLFHCDRGAWPVLAFMLAALLLYRNHFPAGPEMKTLDTIYRQAPRELLQVMSALDPVPSQLRYLQYVSRRNVGSEWPPLDRALTLDCVIIRFIPNLGGDGGCRPIFRIYGQDPFMAADRSTKVLFSTPKRSGFVRCYKQDDELVKIDIHCHVQGDVVLECITLDRDLDREEMMFRVMFNTAFIRSNILMLSRDEVDMLWNAKELYPKDFRAEILFSEMNTDNKTLISMDLPGFEEKEGLPMEAFAKVQEMFSNVDWIDQKTDEVLNIIDGKLDSPSPRISGTEKPALQSTTGLSKPESNSLESNTGGLKSKEWPELHIALQRSTQSKIISQRLPQTSLSTPVSYSNLNSLQGSPVSMCRYHSAPSALGITALLHDHAVSNTEEDLTQTPDSTSPLLSQSSLMTPKATHPKIAIHGTTDSTPTLSPSPPSSSSVEAKYVISTPPPPPPPLPLPQNFISTPPPLPPPPQNVISTPSPPPPPQNLISTPPPPPPPSFLGSSPPSIAKKSFSAPPPPPPPPLIPKTPSPIDSNTSFSSHPLPPPPPPPPHKPPGPASGSTTTSPGPPPPPPPPSSSPGNFPVPPPPAPPLIKGVGNGNVPSVPNPPSLGGKGRGLQRTTSRGQAQPKKTNLKPYHWLKLTRAMQGSLWAEAQKADDSSKAPEFDMLELESLFSAAAPSSDDKISGGLSNRRASSSKPEKVQLIELRRAYNCEIMLSKVKVALPDLMGSVLALDESALDVDQVENLIKFCPTKEEMELLKGFGGDKETLGKCERFFLELMKVPRVESKLKVLAFKIQFHSQVSELRNNLNIVNSSSNEVRGSEKLKRIMQTILSLGNALNQGTARGSAIGFRLDSLLKLTDTRARNNKMTLMHYLCKVLVEKLPELLEFPKDLVNLEASSKIQFKYLAEEMQSVNRGLEKVIQELSASENDGPISFSFCKTLKVFLSHAEAEVRSLTSLYTHVGRNADVLALYFGEDPTRCSFEQVVSTLLNFVRMFERAHEENCKRLESEKKKAKKEAENERIRLGTPRNDSQHLFQTPLKTGNFN